ncbi:UNVERIFIED_CONTAM: hypothetical protein K2H54_019591 [Gekko kuhli]
MNTSRCKSDPPFFKRRVRPDDLRPPAPLFPPRRPGEGGGARLTSGLGDGGIPTRQKATPFIGRCAGPDGADKRPRRVGAQSGERTEAAAERGKAWLGWAGPSSRDGSASSTAGGKGKSQPPPKRIKRRSRRSGSRQRRARAEKAPSLAGRQKYKARGEGGRAGVHTTKGGRVSRRKSCGRAGTLATDGLWAELGEILHGGAFGVGEPRVQGAKAGPC